MTHPLFNLGTVEKFTTLFRDHSLKQIINTCRFGFQALLGFPSLSLSYDPLFLNFYVTARCNLRCQHCRQASEKSQGMQHVFNDLTHETYEWILDLYPGAIAVGLVGGEPLLHPRLFDFIYTAHKRRMKVHIATNGTLLPGKVDAFLKAPVELLNVSFYGIESEGFEQLTHAESSLFEATIKAVGELSRRRARGGYPRVLRTSYICTKQTMREAVNFIRLSEEMGVDQVKLKNLTFFGIPGYEESMCLYEDDKEVRRFIDLLVHERFRIPVFLPRLYQREYQVRLCNMPFRHLNVDGDGFIGPCCEQGTARRCGNVFETPGIWNGDTMTEIRHILTDPAIPLPPVCRNCKEMIPELPSI